MKTELLIDVSGSPRLPVSWRIAATAYFPDRDRYPRPKAAVFAFPGAGYSRHYYDLQIEGEAGYSQVEHHVRRGFIVVACDHLGVGDSTLEAEEAFPLETIAAANATAVGEIARRLETGSLAANQPALPALKHIGAGQSMGGAILLLMQARHGCFDGIALLGSSAIENILPQPTAALTAAARAFFGSLAGNSLGTAAPIPAPPAVVHRYCFHWEDVPEMLVAQDLESGYPVRTAPPHWGSATIPRRGIEVMARHRVAAAAAAITVPVLTAFGERDVSLQPHQEPAAFTASHDVSLFIVPAMAHMHNFAGSRGRLWDRIVTWTNQVLEGQSTGIQSSRLKEN